MASMRCLSVRQPWAWAIIHAGKDIENRTWSTEYRGPLAIHAGKGCTRAEYETAAATIERITGKRPPSLAELPRGYVVGMVELVDCIDGATMETNSPWACDDMVWWWVRNAKPCRAIVARGALGLFEVRLELGGRDVAATAL